MPERLKPAVGTRISCAQRLGCGERDTGLLGPSIHIGDVAGEYDLCPGLHGGCEDEAGEKLQGFVAGTAI